jgi:hypothetical protein
VDIPTSIQKEKRDITKNGAGNGSTALTIRVHI